MGFLSVLIYSLPENRTFGQCLLVANCAIFLVGAALLLFAMEGLICLVMALPIAAVLGSIGGITGFLVQKTFLRQDQAPRVFSVVLLAAPVAMGLEQAVPPALPL